MFKRLLEIEKTTGGQEQELLQTYKSEKYHKYTYIVKRSGNGLFATYPGYSLNNPFKLSQSYILVILLIIQLFYSHSLTKTSKVQHFTYIIHKPSNQHLFYISSFLADLVCLQNIELVGVDAISKYQ